VSLEPVQLAAAPADPTFHLYVVDNVKQRDWSKVGLIDVHGQTLRALLATLKERVVADITIPASIYDGLVERGLPDNTPG
jgi:hypothetical protein